MEVRRVNPKRAHHTELFLNFSFFYLYEMMDINHFMVYVNGITMPYA